MLSPIMRLSSAMVATFGPVCHTLRINPLDNSIVFLSFVTENLVLKELYPNSQSWSGL
jgi:hypothetical protein